MSPGEEELASAPSLTPPQSQTHFRTLCSGMPSDSRRPLQVRSRNADRGRGQGNCEQGLEVGVWLERHQVRSRSRSWLVQVNQTPRQWEPSVVQQGRKAEGRSLESGEELAQVSTD